MKRIILNFMTLAAICTAEGALAQANVTITRQVSAGTDDVEEQGSAGSMYLNSSDLELMTDGSTSQVIGIRFTGLNIPQNATIQHAYIQFTTNGDKNPVSGAITIKAQDADNAATFTSTAKNVSTRPATSQSVTWPGTTDASWGTASAGVSGANQRTPDLKSVVQAVISRTGWSSGNALAFIFTGTGVRNSDSYEGNHSTCAKLIVQYTINTPGVLPAAALPINKGDEWAYLDNGTSLDATQWKTLHYNDTAWSRGPGKLGYSDNAVTVLSYGPNSGSKYITSYFRKRFDVPSLSALGDTIEIGVLRDDAAIIYINGTEVVRSNIQSGSINYLTFSSSIVDGVDESTYYIYKIPKTAFVSGQNVIAVEVHQRDGTSSDLGFDLTMRELPDPSIIRGPYLQMATTQSINIRWRTDLAATSRIHFGLAPNALTQTVVDSVYKTEHELQLTGLTPHTKYYYSIGSLTDTMQGDTSNFFMTLRPAGDKSLLRIGVFGDCGNNSTNQRNVRDQMISYLDTNYMDSWILLGDNAYSSGTETEYQSGFFNIYKDNFLKQNPLFPAPGNHDYSGGSAAAQLSHNIPYYSIFTLPTNAEVGGVASNNEAYYSFDIGNVHFLSLDSYGEEDAGTTRMYDTTGAQVTWIKADLAANTNKEWVVAYWHHPPYSKSSHNSDTEDQMKRIRENFIQILERMGVDLILCGHSHGYERSKLMHGHYGLETTFDSAMHNLSFSSGLYDTTANSCPYIKDSVTHLEGTVYVVSGSAGQLGGTTAGYPHDAMYYSNTTNGGSMILEVEGNRMDAKWICADGVIRDKFTLMKNTNFTNTTTINEGDSVVLTAGFNGEYTWTNSTQTTKSITVKPSDTTVYIVKDKYDCVVDSFTVNVIPKPVQSVNDVKGGLLADVILAPNPARNNEMTISLETKQPVAVKISLTDLAGKLVFMNEMVLSTTPQLFLPDLNAGIYVLSVKGNNVNLYKKLVIE